MSKFDQSLEVLRRNIDAYKLMHVHVTYSEPLPESIRQVHHITPYGNVTKEIYISSEKVASVTEFLRVVHKLDEEKVLGIKIEGVIPLKPIRDFCYYELHMKRSAEELDEFDATWHLVYSAAINKIIGTRRYYNRDASVQAKEVCIYEHWFEDMDAEWLGTPWKQQYETLKLYLAQ